MRPPDIMVLVVQAAYADVKDSASHRPIIYFFMMYLLVVSN